MNPEIIGALIGAAATLLAAVITGVIAHQKLKGKQPHNKEAISNVRPREWPQSPTAPLYLELRFSRNHWDKEFRLPLHVGELKPPLKVEKVIQSLWIRNDTYVKVRLMHGNDCLHEEEKHIPGIFFFGGIADFHADVWILLTVDDEGNIVFNADIGHSGVHDNKAKIRFRGDIRDPKA